MGDARLMDKSWYNVCIEIHGTSKVIKKNVPIILLYTTKFGRGSS